MDQTIVHPIYVKRGSLWAIVGAKYNLVLKIKYNRQIVFQRAANYAIIQSYPCKKVEYIVLSWFSFHLQLQSSI